MSDERIEKAWRGVYGEDPMSTNSFERMYPYKDCEIREKEHDAFEKGYLAGRADALTLPEVKWQHMKFGAYYLGCWKDEDRWPSLVKVYGESCGDKLVATHGLCHKVSEFTKFLGPLPLQGVTK